MSTPTATPHTDDTPYQATPSADLRQQIMDSRVPKNEREWWAQRTIEKLETELAAARSDIAHYLRDNLTAHQMACAAGLERDQLRAEVEALKQSIESGQRVLREDAERNAARAERAEAESDALAKDKARLDWLSVSDAWFDFPATGAFTPETMRAAIDAAMKGTT